MRRSHRAAYEQAAQAAVAAGELHDPALAAAQVITDLVGVFGQAGQPATTDVLLQPKQGVFRPARTIAVWRTGSYEEPTVSDSTGSSAVSWYVTPQATVLTVHTRTSYGSCTITPTQMSPREAATQRYSRTIGGTTYACSLAEHVAGGLLSLALQSGHSEEDLLSVVPFVLRCSWNIPTSLDWNYRYESSLAPQPQPQP